MLEALDAFDQVLTLQPRHTGALLQLGAIADGAGRPDRAEAFFRRAAEADPKSAEAWTALAALTHGQARLDEAAAALDKALALRPDPDLLMNLGNLRREQRRLTEAEVALRRSLQMRSGSALAWRNLAVILQEQGRAADAIAAYDRALALDPDFAEAARGRLFCLNYDEGRPADDVAREHRAWGERVQARAPKPAPWPNPPDPERRLRLGYVSGDFHTHPVGWFLAEALAAQDRGQVEATCYSTGPHADTMTERLKAASDRWRDIAALDDASAAAQVRADAIDVLVDLSGHTAHGRLSLFALKPAPVQAAWLGYVATTGLPAVDYVQTDAETVPPGSERLFSETVLRSPAGRFCYAPPAYAPEVTPPPSASGRPFTFASFNDTLKLGPRTIRLWAQVLKAAPGSRLLLKWLSLGDEGVRTRIAAAFAAEGVEADRLLLRGYSPHADMLAEYAEVDLALDPADFSGGMTSCEALWMGVPVIALPGEKPASRQTLAFLQRLGLPDLAATSEVDYVAKAAALAHDPARLAAFRADLRPRMQASPVRQSARFTAAHEALIRQMWREWCAVQRPPARPAL